MATVPFTFQVLSNTYNALGAEWADLLNTDDGAPFDLTGPGRSIFASVRGTFGAGGTVVIQGSADGIQWATMIQVNNSAASFTGAGGSALRGTPRFIRPLVTGGDGSTNLTVTLYMPQSPASE